MQITAVANQKGGCGKTTTAVQLAAALAQRRRRVLLVDLDPQGHASMAVGVPTDQLSRSLYHALVVPGPRAELAEVLVPVDDWLHLAPSDVRLCGLEQSLAGLPGREFQLADCLRSLNSLYDNVIIDCPPSTGLLTFNALAAADLALAPLECSVFALQGLDRLLEMLNLVDRETGRTPALMGVVTRFDGRSRHARDMLETARATLGDRAAQTVIRANIHLAMAAARGVPAQTAFPRCRGVADYEALTQELLPRLGDGEAAQRAFPRREGDHEVAFAFPKSLGSGRGVALLGDFNNWTLDENAMLHDNGQDLLVAHHPLPPGKYQYKFVVDGDWHVDPFNPLMARTDDGALNSLVVVNG